MFCKPTAGAINLDNNFQFIVSEIQFIYCSDVTGSRRFVCVGIPAGRNIDFTDNLDHRQLYAQALHLFNQGERFWLEDDEIQTLIEENVPYQRTVDLVEMVNETFRKPKDGEGGDEQLPLQLPSPHGERLFGVLVVREID